MRFSAALLMLVSLAGAHTSAASTSIFLVDTDVGTPSTVFRVDQSTGQLTTIASLPDTLGEVLALAAASSDTLYAVGTNGDVLQITVSGPTVTTVGDIGPNNITGLAFADGQLYAVDEATDTLSTIQLSPTVTQAVIGTVTLDSPSGPVLDLEGGDLAQDGVDPTLWYLWTNSAQALYRLDVTTAVATAVDPGASGLGTKAGLAFDYDSGNLLLASSLPLDSLFTLDTATGIPLAGVTFCLSCPTPYSIRYGDLASARDVATPTATATPTNTVPVVNPPVPQPPPTDTPTPSPTPTPTATPLSGTLIIRSVRIKASTHGYANGTLRLRGMVEAPDSTVAAVRNAIKTDGLTVSIREGGLTAPREITFSPSLCFAFGGLRFECVEGLAVVDIHGHRGAGPLTVTLTESHTDLALLPLAARNVQVSITTGGIEMYGEASCAVGRQGRRALCPNGTSQATQSSP